MNCFVQRTIVFSQTVTLDKYHQPNEVKAILQSLAKEYLQISKLITIGKSEGGHDLLILQIAADPANNSTADSKPGILVSANIEGVHLIGTEAALFFAERLLDGNGTDDQITALLKKHTVYIAPLQNPDAAGNFFAAPKYETAANNHPVDEDLDELVDEDGPDDLNKDAG